MIVFAIVSLGVSIRTSLTQRDSDAIGRDGLYAVLFRGGSYCPTCDIMQDLSSAMFARGELTGGYEFETVNFEAPGNEHYIFDYDIYTTTIVLIERRDGVSVRWRNLEESWEWAETGESFEERLADAMARFAGGA